MSTIGSLFSRLKGRSAASEPARSRIFYRRSPFSGLTDHEMYAVLLGERESRFPCPLWPDEQVQVGFISRSGVGAIRAARPYLNLLEDDGAFDGDWKGLDYGCGFGRFASLMLHYGPPERVDICDPMPYVQKLTRELCLENEFFLVPQVLEDDSEPQREYSFIFAYSVFTHFARQPFEANFLQLLARLRPGGKLYATFRDRDFLENFANFWHPDNAEQKRQEFEAKLNADTFLFEQTLNDPERRDFWGSAFVTEEYLRNLMPEGFTMTHLGGPILDQKLYAFKRPVG